MMGGAWVCKLQKLQSRGWNKAIFCWFVWFALLGDFKCVIVCCVLISSQSFQLEKSVSMYVHCLPMFIVHVAISSFPVRLVWDSLVGMSTKFNACITWSWQCLVCDSLVFPCPAHRGVDNAGNLPEPRPPLSGTHPKVGSSWSALSKLRNHPSLVPGLSPNVYRQEWGVEMIQNIYT